MESLQAGEHIRLHAEGDAAQPHRDRRSCAWHPPPIPTHTPCYPCHGHLCHQDEVFCRRKLCSIGNRNWSSKTFTSLVPVSYSNRLWVPTAKDHTRRVHSPYTGLEPCSPSGHGPMEGDSASHWSDRPLVALCSALFQAGP